MSVRESEFRPAVLVAASPLAAVYLRQLFQSIDASVYYPCDYQSATDLLNQREYELIVLTLRFDRFSMFEVLKQVRQCQRNSNSTVLCLRATASPLAKTCDRSTKMALKVLGANYFWDISFLQQDTPMQGELRDFLVSELQALFPQKRGSKQVLLSKLVRSASRIEDLHDRFPQVS